MLFNQSIEEDKPIENNIVVEDLDAWIEPV